MLKVQPLGNHLRTYQYIGLSLLEVGNDFLVSRTSTGGIQIHSCHPCFGEDKLDIILDALRAETLMLKLHASTSRTRAGNLVGASAIVASEHIQALVIGQTHVAILALGHPTTSVTLYHRGKTTTVLKEDNLLFPFKGIVYLLHQHGREGTLHPLLMRQFLDVHPFDVRKLDVFVSFFQLHQAILTVGSIEIGFHTRCGGTQEHFRPIHRGEHYGRTTGMVSGSRILLLVRVFVLLIHNHQAQSLKGQEDGRTDTQDDIVFLFTQLLLPDFHPLGIGKLGMIDTKATSEYPLQTFGDLGGQGDFGQEIEHLLTCLQRFLDEVDIDFGLATGGDPVK